MKLLTFLCVALLTALVGVSPAQEKAQGAPRTLEDELGFKGFNLLKKAVISAGLVDKLSGSEPLTILAPTDVAFRDLPKAQLDALMSDKAKLVTLLNNHIIAGRVSSADLKKAPPQTLAGTSPESKVVDGKLKVMTATVVKPDIAASNGVIHGIDKLLWVP